MKKKGNKGGLFFGVFVLISLVSLIFFLDKTFIGNVVDEGCISNATNSTVTSWVNQTSCFSNGTLIQNRSFLEYDLNNCTSFVNITHFEFQEANCTFVCVYNFTNTSWSSWKIQGNCTEDLQLQSRSKVQYDINNCNSSLENQTFWDYKNVSCISCMSSLVNISSSWEDNSSCEGGLKSQIRLITQNDKNNCSNLTLTFHESQNVSCEIVNVPVETPLENISLAEVQDSTILSDNSSFATSDSVSPQEVINRIILFLLVLGVFIAGIIFWFMFRKKDTEAVSYNSATPYTPS